MLDQKISIIIPVFNSELFLNKCIDSVIGQTYSNLQIIIVNDGSTDKSKTIIEDYKKIDKRIVSIHKENRGLGSALIEGLKLVIGRFVTFIDSDDWFENKAIEDTLNMILKSNADMISFGVRAFNTSGELVDLSSFNNIDFIASSNEDVLKTHFEVLKHPTLVRLYRKELFDDIVIFEQNVGIDEMLTPQLLLRCNKVVFTSNIYYNVLVRTNSVCRAVYNDNKVLQTIKVYHYLNEFFEKNLYKYKETIKLKYIQILNGILLGYHNKEYMLDSPIVQLVKKDLLKYTLLKIKAGKTAGLSLKEIGLIFINTTPLSILAFNIKKNFK